MKAVLTGDIVNSTTLQASVVHDLLRHLEAVLDGSQFEFFRGDSLQAYFENPAVALRVAMRCRTAALSIMVEGQEIMADVRVSIGIGGVELPVRDLATARGEAFLLSGRALDALGKSAGTIIMVDGSKLTNLCLDVMSDYINSVFRQLTPKQAEVIHLLLAGLNQQQVAETLKRSKSTISQHATAGKWDELEKILSDYEKLTQLISS
jgi:hypothetical protein